MTAEGRTSVQDLLGGPLRSAPRMGLDLLFWAGAAAGAACIDRSWATVVAIAWIGAFPMHDLLVHGHEGAHRHLARPRWLNELLSWFVHALVGISGVAYRTFHLDHHRWVRTPRDPERRLLSRIASGIPGWAYLAIPAVAQIEVNSYPFRARSPRPVRGAVLRDLAGMVLLHGGLALALGRGYLLWVLAPAFTSLAIVITLRSVCEHHATEAGDPWTETRTMDSGALLDFLWSNTGYHLEHHLYPAVPFDRLPEVRRRISGELVRRGSCVDRGFLRTSLALLREPHHFRKALPTARAFVDPGSLAFGMKVRWFRDILAHPPARRHLWSLYFAGEAYEELHPDGVFVAKLDPPLDRLLARHLEDETRHATIFRGLLAADGLAPATLPPMEDVGWYLLTHVVPDVVAAASRLGAFTPEETARYMAFLHVLELRSLSDLCALIEAARGRGEHELADRLATILKDERFHASYTHTAVVRLTADRRKARAVLCEVLRAERRHYADVLRGMLRRFEDLGTRPGDTLGRWRWRLMRVAAVLGLAVPRLPIYATLPARLLPSERV